MSWAHYWTNLKARPCPCCTVESLQYLQDFHIAILTYHARTFSLSAGKRTKQLLLLQASCGCIRVRAVQRTVHSPNCKHTLQTASHRHRKQCKMIGRRLVKSSCGHNSDGHASVTRGDSSTRPVVPVFNVFRFSGFSHSWDLQKRQQQEEEVAHHVLSPSNTPKRAPDGFSRCDEPSSLRSLIWHRHLSKLEASRLEGTPSFIKIGRGNYVIGSQT